MILLSNSRKNKVNFKVFFLYTVFFLYILFLIKLLFLSRVSYTDMMTNGITPSDSINLVPFDSINAYLAGRRAFAFGNVAGNIAIFIPLGIFLLLFKKRKGIILNFFSIFILSSLVEVIQWFFGIGAADIDDIILNSLGGFIGIIIFKFLMLFLKDIKRVENVVVIFSAIGLPFLILLLFFVRLQL